MILALTLALACGSAPPSEAPVSAPLPLLARGSLAVQAPDASPRMPLAVAEGDRLWLTVGRSHPSWLYALAKDHQGRWLRLASRPPREGSDAPGPVFPEGRSVDAELAGMDFVVVVVSERPLPFLDGERWDCTGFARLGDLDSDDPCAFLTGTASLLPPRARSVGANRNRYKVRAMQVEGHELQALSLTHTRPGLVGLDFPLRRVRADVR